MEASCTIRLLRQELKATRAALARERSLHRRRGALYERAIRSNDLRQVGAELYRYLFRHLGVFKGDITVLSDYDERELFDTLRWMPRGAPPRGEWIDGAAGAHAAHLKKLVEEQIFIGYSPQEEERIRRSGLLEQSMLECMLSKRPRIVNDVRKELSPGEVREAGMQGTRAWLNWVVPHPDNGKMLAKLHMSFRSPKAFTHKGLSESLRPFEDLLRYRILHTRDFRRAKFLSERDALTGFYLRPVLAARLERMLEEAARSRKPLTVGMMDLDFFKRFNDEHGHDVGDRVLRRFAQAVQGALRGSDIVGRYGGEEFVALFPGASAQDALAILWRVHERIKDTDFLRAPRGAGRQPGRLRFSAGVVTLALGPDSPPPSFEEVIKAADDLLLKSKAAGRNRCRWRDAHGRTGELRFRD